MPRLLNLRALCSSCERAEASHWCGTSSSALCAACLHRRPASSSSPVPVPIVSRSVVAALCGRCGVAPAAVVAVDAATPLCEICAPREQQQHQQQVRSREKTAQQRSTTLVPLRESAIAHGLVFDKMDFSCLYQGNSDAKTTETEGRPEHHQRAGKLDLSYYKTPVPISLVNSKSRKKKRGKRDTVDNSPEKERSRRRR